MRKPARTSSERGSTASFSRKFSAGPPTGWKTSAWPRQCANVGKIGIPDAILRKPGKLTREEFEVMKTHAVIGAKMLAGSESSVLQMAEAIALCHHERWDGGGYPRGLAESAIPETARIVALVNV